MLFVGAFVAQQHPAPTQAWQVTREVLQHLHIGRGQLFGMLDEDHLLGPAGMCGCLHGLGQPQLPDTLVNMAEKSQAFKTHEIVNCNRWCLLTTPGKNGVGHTGHGFLVHVPNDQVLVIVENHLIQIFQFSRSFLLTRWGGRLEGRGASSHWIRSIALWTSD